MSGRAEGIAQRYVTALLVVSAIGCARSNLEPTPPNPVRSAQVTRPAIELRPVVGTQGIGRERTLLVVPLESARARLEVRTLSIAQTDGIVLPTTSEVAFEIRSGDVETVINGVRQGREPGAMFVVPAGSRALVRVFGEQAVLRGIYIVRVP